MDNVFLYKNSFILHENVKSSLCFGDIELCPKPMISIILPVYNRPQTLAKALLSAIHQVNAENYEIVIVDNNEIHPSPNLDVVKRLATNSTNVFYYQHEENIGMYGNFNRGIQLARGEYITFCHDDDFLEPIALSTLVSMLPVVDNGECIIGEHKIVDDNDIVICNSTMNNLPLLKKRLYFKYSMFDMFIRGAGIGGGGSLFKRENIIKMGGFREDLYPGSDYALFINYQHNYGCIYLTIPTYNYRKAENESKKVFLQFPELELFFMECMKPFIKLPNSLLSIIIKAKYKYSVVSLSREWGEERSGRYSLSFFISKIIIVLLRGLLKLKASMFPLPSFMFRR